MVTVAIHKNTAGLIILSMAYSLLSGISMLFTNHAIPAIRKWRAARRKRAVVYVSRNVNHGTLTPRRSPLAYCRNSMIREQHADSRQEAISHAQNDETSRILMDRDSHHFLGRHELSGTWPALAEWRYLAGA